MKNRQAKSDKKAIISIIALVVIGCLLMAMVDAVFSADYAVKSAIKLALFLMLPFGYCLLDKEVSFKSLFIVNKKSVLTSLGMGLAVYIIIIVAYFGAGRFFDLSNITNSLTDNIGVSKSNFVFVAIYISFINSLLEEFFFRGFAFLSLKKLAGRKIAYVFSASAFSLYHIAIMASWFSIWLLTLIVLSLFIAGLMFNWLNEKNENIYNSWLVHMFANFAINTIGFILFGII